MAFGKKLIDEALGKKKGKAGQFLEGLKNWAVSPGGIATLLLFAIAMWYIHHHSKGKKSA